MPRFLFVTIPASGHVNPTLPIARALAQRGHDVAYATGPNMAGAVAPLVTRFYPVGPDASAAAMRQWWPDMGQMRGLRRLNFMISQVMFAFAESVAQEVLDVADSLRPDVLVFDAFTHPASIVAERTGLPWATTTVVPGLLNTGRAHPYGLGLAYPPRLHVRLATPLLRWLLRAAARRHDRQFNAIRARFALPPRRNCFLESAISPHLVLALVPQEFEYPRRAWPPTVHFVGPCLWDRPHDYAVPGWLEALPGARPLVYATIGTVQSVYQAAFFGKLFAAAGALDADVVVTTGGNASDLPPPPANVRVERYVPNSVIIPKATVVLHHGGVSSTMGALQHGKPAVVVPFADDQPDNAQRLRRLGVGTTVDPYRVSGEELRAAITDVLARRAMHHRAADLGQQLRQYDAGQAGAALLERLAVSKAPVVR